MREYQRPDHLSASSLGVLDECPRKFFYSRGVGLVPPGVNVALLFGKAVHEGLHGLYGPGGLEDGLVRFETCFRAWEGLDGTRTLEKGKELLRAWADQFQLEEEGETLDQEIEVSQDLAPGMVFVGLIDRLVLREGEVEVHEWKTSSWPREFVSHPNFQITGYVEGVRQQLQKAAKRGVVTIAGVFKGSRDGKMKQRDGGSHSVFTRELVDLEPVDFEEWRADLRGKLGEMLEYEKQGYWPKRTGSCGKWGGCPYLVLCQSVPELREALMEGNYDIERVRVVE
jgi:hypothetical protein